MCFSPDFDRNLESLPRFVTESCEGTFAEPITGENRNRSTFFDTNTNVIIDPDGVFEEIITLSHGKV